MGFRSLLFSPRSPPLFCSVLKTQGHTYTAVTRLTFRRDHENTTMLYTHGEQTQQASTRFGYDSLTSRKRYEKRRYPASLRPRNNQSYVSAHLCLWRLGSGIWRLFRSLSLASLFGPGHASTTHDHDCSRATTVAALTTRTNEREPNDCARL